MLLGLALSLLVELGAIGCALYFSGGPTHAFNLGDAIVDLAGLAALRAFVALGIAIACALAPARDAPSPSTLSVQDGRGSTASTAGMSMVADGGGARAPLLTDEAKAEEGTAAAAAGAPAAKPTKKKDEDDDDRMAKHPHLRRRRDALYAALALQLSYCTAKCLFRLVRDAPPSARATGVAWFWLALGGAVLAPGLAHACAQALVRRELDRIDPPEAKRFRMRVSDVARLCAPDWPIFVVAFVGLSVAAAGEALIPYLYGAAIDAAAIDEDDAKFDRFMLYLVATAAVTGLCTGVRGSSFIWAGGRFATRLRARLFEALLAQEIGFYDATKTGDVASRLTSDCQKVSDQVELNVNVFLRSFLQAVLTLAFMFGINLRLGMLAFVTVPNIVLGSKIFGSYMRKIAKGVQKALADATGDAEEVIGTMRTVKAHHAQAEMVRKFEVHMANYVQLCKQEALVYFPFSALTYTFLPYCASVVVMYYGGKLVSNGSISGGDLVSFVLYMQSLFAAFNSLGSIYAGLVQAFGAAEKVFEWCERAPAVAEPRAGEGLAPAKCDGELRLVDVHFRYPSRPDAPVLNGLTLVARPGEVVALCGASGGGKSSVMALLQHWYEPERGEVLLDGHPVAALCPRWFHRQVAMVSQEPVLYACSIRENILLGLGDVGGDGESRAYTDADVEEACKLANAHSFIAGFPDQYETTVGERGAQLSGGQKQRIAIARALVRRPAVLLLDEATSALDADSEYLVQAAIDDMISSVSMTVMIIAHRLSTIRNANTIAVVKGGAVVEQGTHDELLAAEGAYATLVNRQMSRADSRDNIEALSGGAAKRG